MMTSRASQELIGKINEPDYHYFQGGGGERVGLAVFEGFATLRFFWPS